MSTALKLAEARPLGAVLAEAAVAFRTGPLPASAIHAAKRALLDWAAAAIAGGATEQAAMLRRAVAEDLGHGRATVIADARPATARTAALVNGTTSHIVEFDDIYRDAIYHPGCPVIGAALALGESEDVAGDRFLRAVIAGYEISCRLGAAMMPAHYRHWHTTGTVGAFGAAVAAAVVLGLDAARIEHAIGTAGTFAAGLQQAFRSDAMSKPLHAGRAAEAGVLAALAAREGITAPPDILDGEVGYGVATANGEVDWRKAVDGLGSWFAIERVTVKNHGCCGHTFAAIDGAQRLMRDHGFMAADIERIVIRTYQVALDVTGGRRVTTPFEGRFSLPFVVASALVHGSVRLDGFEPERLASPPVHALMGRLVLEADPALTAAYPSQRAANVAITLRDGRTVEHFQAYRRGDPEEPLSDDDLRAKFDELAGKVIGAERAAALEQAIWGADRLSVRALAEKLRQA